MQVRICSREEFEPILRQGLPDNAAVIYFYNIGTGPLDLSSELYDLYQVSMEAIGIELDEPNKCGLTDKTFFPEADLLAQFIFYAKAACLGIICVCENGRGPSAGCAAAIRQFFDGDGIEVFSNYYYMPNKRIYHKVFNALIVESFERGEVHCRRR